MSLIDAGLYSGPFHEVEYGECYVSGGARARALESRILLDALINQL